MNKTEYTLILMAIKDILQSNSTKLALVVLAYKLDVIILAIGKVFNGQ